MTNLLDYQKRVEARKRWNRTIAQFDETVDKCEQCNGPMETLMVIDPVNGTEYYPVCKNPDCPINN